MGIELEWVKKIKCGTDKKSNKFFLAPFNFYNKNNNSCEATRPKALREIDKDLAECKADTSIGPSCNLPGASGTVSIPVSSLTQRISKQFKKMVLTEKENGIFPSFKRLKSIFGHLLTFSLSFFKQTYPQSWKTIFVHLFEKSNLLVRSDNNTGVSSSKFLQTTTI